MISKLERGQIGDVNVDTLRSVTAALDAVVFIDLRWHGGAVDRLLDEKHARVLGATVELLVRHGWATEVEVTYSVYGERGSIDILAWHEPSRVLLVIEIKSELVTVEATLRKLDEKQRLAGAIGHDRLGRRPDSVARMLVLPSTSTERRRVARHAAALDAALPLRYDDLRAWLRRPVGAVSGILFVADITGRDARRDRVTSRRVRGPAKAPSTV